MLILLTMPGHPVLSMSTAEDCSSNGSTAGCCRPQPHTDTDLCAFARDIFEALKAAGETGYPPPEGLSATRPALSNMRLFKKIGMAE